MSAAEVRATNVTASTEVAATAKVTASTSTEVTASTAVTAATAVAAATATATASGQGGCGAENQRQQHNAYSTSSPHDIPPRQNPVGLIC